VPSLIHHQYLQDAADDTDINAAALINGTPVYSKAINNHFNDGYAYLNVVLADTPDVDISYEVSPDGNRWYPPYDLDGNNVGTIITALTSSRWLVFEPVISKFIRFLIDPDANSTVSVEYGHKETIV